MQLSKEEYARKRFQKGSLVQIENSVTRVTAQHRMSLVMPNSYPRDGMFNLRLTPIKDSYILSCCIMGKSWFTDENGANFFFNFQKSQKRFSVGGVKSR